MSDEEIADIADATNFMARADVLADDDGGLICRDFARAIERRILGSAKQEGEAG
jgi:hypothetical protein